MAPNPRRQDAALDALYAEIPTLHCRGMCSDCCGPIETSVRERQRIEHGAGKPLTCGPLASCSMLTPSRKCGVYSLRPLICRLWGVTRSMRCHYGCRPERWLSDEEAVELILRTDLIGGASHGREARLREVLAEHGALLRAAEYIAATSAPATLEKRAAAMPRTVIHMPATANGDI